MKNPFDAELDIEDAVFTDIIPEQVATDENLKFTAPPPHKPHKPINPPALPEATLPVDAFDIHQQAIFQAVAQTHQIDEGFCALQTLVTVGAALGRGVELREAVPGHKQRANLFTLAIAETGYGKDAAAKIHAPIETASIAMSKKWRECRPILANEKAGLDAVFKKGKASPEQSRRRDELEEILSCEPRMIVRSATGAALEQIASVSDGTLFYANPEAGEPLRIALGRYTSDGGSDSDFLLSAFTGAKYSSERISRKSVFIERPCLSLAWMVQPFLWAEIGGNREFCERGLLGRFLIYKVHQGDIPEDDGNLPEIPGDVSRAWQNLIDQCLSLRENPVTFTATPAARDVFREFHNHSVRLRNGVMRDIRERLARWRELACRISLQIAAIDHLQGGGLELTADHARRGVGIASYFLAKNLELFEAGRREALEARAEKLHQIATFKGNITLGILKKNHSFEPGEVQRIVEAFPERFEIREATHTEAGGRPSYVLHTRQ
ncbi:DUF3987 domain-containing protein [Kamptonema cortianum]|nr:DUF3987 domain-containing protein [Oscillatoria laete-virens]MDK3159488.1 DUF3987 domain-containing protein [Kamptonema cortianum]MDL5044562.1 DUF3987 domain-containing protein [Oscillatoria amoena NRMC-F 0135]MDL5053028.1 DUF3987 domain-containing protein [Oscillatoria laete-virens NRMC-F 0139]